MTNITIKTTATNNQFVAAAISAAGERDRIISDRNRRSHVGPLVAWRNVYFALEAMREDKGWSQAFKFITKRVGVAVGER